MYIIHVGLIINNLIIMFCARETLSIKSSPCKPYNTCTHSTLIINKPYASLHST